MHIAYILTKERPRISKSFKFNKKNRPQHTMIRRDKSFKFNKKNRPEHTTIRRDIISLPLEGLSELSIQNIFLKGMPYYVRVVCPLTFILMNILAHNLNSCDDAPAYQLVTRPQLQLACQWNFHGCPTAVQRAYFLLTLEAVHDDGSYSSCTTLDVEEEEMGSRETGTDSSNEILTEAQYESHFESLSEKAIATIHQSHGLHSCTSDRGSSSVNVMHPEILQTRHDDAPTKKHVFWLELTSEEESSKNDAGELSSGHAADKCKLNFNLLLNARRRRSQELNDTDVFCSSTIRSPSDIRNLFHIYRHPTPQRLSVAAFPVRALLRVSSSLLLRRAVASHESASQIGLFRLASFTAWPKLGKLSALRCCLAGFYHTTTRDGEPGRDSVTCFSCGCTASQWTSGADPQSLHVKKCRQHCRFAAELHSMANLPHDQLGATDCPDVTGVCTVARTSMASVTSCGPQTSSVTAWRSSLTDELKVRSSPVFAHTSTGSKPDAELEKHERYRRSTFSNVWEYDHIVDAQELAKNGFFYAGPGDRVQCAFCRGLLRNWEAGDRVDEQHATHFSYCRFVQGHDVGNVPIPFWPLEKESHSANAPSSNQSREFEASLGISCAIPRCPDFAIEARRLSTYATWPQSHHMQPEALSKAGFFYLGKEDTAQCFFCGGIVVDWRTDCDPWVEHAQRFPNCQFLVQVRGSEIVQRRYLNSEPPPSTTKTSLAVDPREVRARMDSSKVRIVLQMDYPADLVREVVQKRLATDGADYETSEKLLESLFQTHDEKQRASVAAATAKRGALPAEPIWTSVLAAEDPYPAAAMNHSSSAYGLSAASEREDHPPNSTFPASGMSPEEENRQLKTQLTCKVCMDSLVGIVFLPCGHLVCCASCAPAMTTCPICRVSIRGTVRTSYDVENGFQSTTHKA